MATQRVLKRFPFNLSVGTDICHVVRIRNILESSKGARFVHRILNVEERGHPKIQRFLSSQYPPASATHETSRSCLTHLNHTAGTPHVKTDKGQDTSRKGHISHDLEVAATFVAGRFAAKEAVIKAHPHRPLTWHDITISNQSSAHPDRKGAPVAIIKDINEDCEALISISHDGEYATAVCVGAHEI